MASAHPFNCECSECNVRSGAAAHNAFMKTIAREKAAFAKAAAGHASMWTLEDCVRGKGMTCKCVRCERVPASKNVMMPDYLPNGSILQQEFADQGNMFDPQSTTRCACRREQQYGCALRHLPVPARACTRASAAAAVVC